MQCEECVKETCCGSVCGGCRTRTVVAYVRGVDTDCVVAYVRGVDTYCVVVYVRGIGHELRCSVCERM